MKPLLALFVVLGATAAFAEADPWPCFRGNPQRSGLSAAAGPTRGTVAWRFAAGAPIRSSPAIGGNGTIYVGSDAGKLYALAADGSLRAEIALGGRIWGGPLLARERIFAGSDDEHLYALSWQEGALRLAWKLRTRDFIYGSPGALGEDVVVGSWDGGLYRARAANGKKVWRYKARGDLESSPALAPDGRTLYVGSRDRKLHAVTEAGKLRWKFGTRDSVNSTPAVAPDGRIYVGSDDGHLYALTPAGRKRWAFAAEADVLSSPALSPDAKTVYVGSHDGHLYAVDAQTGKLRWKHDCDVVWSSPAVDARGEIYFGAWDGKVYALSPAGEVRFAVATGGPIWSSPALAPGRLYIGSNDGHLYAIE
jgi:outer membrane protein assembly factor BamB